ncbi:glutamine synthetase family protein [Halofilum ochraceum]|uniref:glutamine synthetase family protein n=1 Tax=Halofilum ochraceum TaxID=1611323 RepID=UPI0009F3AFDF|nr:glutamine synthetase family protein [Halofilum ochraceum]
MSEEKEDTGTPAEVERFLDRYPGLEYIEAFVTDINGIARGKRVPAAALARLYDKGLCLPASTLILDVWGNEVEASGLIFDTGDADHPCWPIAGTLQPLPWTEGRGGQLLLRMETPDTTPYHADPRNVLVGVAERFAARGQTPVIATELEFRLFEPEPAADGSPVPPTRLGRGGGSQLFGLDELDVMDAVFSEIDRACRAQGVPADTVIAEQSDGQYEVNLTHVGDPVAAADHAILLKRTIKAVARRHGLVASFMAKPFGDEAGNGLHVHASLLDRDGNNIFTDGERPTAALHHAVGGLMETMYDAAAVFAPHANSWRRFQVGAHVPMGPTWGFDNRTTAVRVPLSSPAATRVEHRVAGADANPYLAVAAILAGIDHGLANAVQPPPETKGSAFNQHAPGLPETWESALGAFGESAFVAEYFGEEYRRLFTVCKRQEQARFRRDVPRFEYESYLGAI